MIDAVEIGRAECQFKTVLMSHTAADFYMPAAGVDFIEAAQNNIAKGATETTIKC